MDVGLSIAASGMLAEQLREDQLANDLANASTPGYKPDQVEQGAFGAILLSGGSPSQPQQVGPVASQVRVTKEVTNLAQGGLQSTGDPLDFAISGPGFFAVRTSAGVRYTRDGQFSAAADGGLVDGSGNAVLDQAGKPVTLRATGTAAASDLGLFNVTGTAKQGGDLFSGAAAGRAAGIVQSGVLESSGVDPARTIVDMIAALNDYQAGQKVIQTIDQVEQRSASTVGGLGAG
jgi:flagellar basal-body rod protein FlgF